MLKEIIDKLNLEDKLVLAKETTDENILTILYQEMDINIMFNVLNNKNCPKTIIEPILKELEYTNDLKLLEESSNIKNIEFRKHIANNLTCSNEILEKFINEEDDLMLLQFVASNFNISDNSINKLLEKNQDEKIKLELLDNNGISFETFLKIANDENKLIKDYAIKKLENDFNDEQLYDILMNKNCPPYILDYFAKETNEYNLIAISKNPNTSKETLHNLSKNENFEIVYNVIENPSTSIKTHNSLLVNDDLDIRNKTFQHLSKSSDDSIRYDIANNKKTPEDVLESMKNDKSINVICALASNPNTPFYIIEDLAATSKNKNVQINLVENPNISKEILEKLCESNHFEVVEKSMEKLSAFDNNQKDICNSLNKEFELMVNKNWKTKIELLMRDDCPTKYFEQLSYDTDPLVRQYVASNDNCPSNVLASLVNDKYNICFKILENPNCTKEILEELSKHKDNDVKSRALEKLSELNNKHDNSILLEVLDDYVDKDTNTNTNTRR